MKSKSDDDASRALRVAGAVFGLALTTVGAAGAHILHPSLTNQQLVNNEILAARIEQLASWQSAILFGWVHTLAALWTGYVVGRSGWVRLGGWLFLVGVALFSGTIILGQFLSQGSATTSFPGWIAPFGGGAFIAGWCALLLEAIKGRARNSSQD